MMNFGYDNGIFLKCETKHHKKNEKCYIHNIFKIFSQQILSDKLLLVDVGEKKSNLICGFN